VLEWLRLDSAGDRKDDNVPVFCNEAGEPRKTFKKGWVVAVLKAHGVDLRWRKGSYKDHSAECQQRFRDINLHWHDLRHEYASRLVEQNVPFAQVRDLLGHASIFTTERLRQPEAGGTSSSRRKAGRRQDVRPQIEAADNLSAVAVSTDSAKAEVSRIFQDPTEQGFADGEDPPTKPTEVTDRERRRLTPTRHGYLVGGDHEIREAPLLTLPTHSHPAKDSGPAR
jgi:hypothetical protein